MAPGMMVLFGKQSLTIAKGHLALSHDRGSWKGVDKNVNHAQCTQSIVDYIVGKDLTDIVLLGHSFQHHCEKLLKRFPIAFDGSSSSMPLSSMMVRASEITFHRIIKLTL